MIVLNMFFKVVLLFLLVSTACGATISLEQYNVDPDSVTISGVSAGGAMATQYHVIHSQSTKGVALFAGIVYHCANGILSTALSCMSSPYLTSTSNLIDKTNTLASSGDIDAVTGMSGDKVFIWQGELDTTVMPANADHIEQFYTAFGSDVNMLYSLDAVHCQPTDYYGPSCDYVGGEYINNCNYPGSYEALNFMYDHTLTKVDETFTLSGTLSEFDQKEFFSLNNPSSESVDDIGFIYVPSGCADRATTCKLHVVFHGCGQGRYELDDVFASNTGYLQVAESNNIITLFPQAISKAISNPNGCWDWWGYTGSNKYVTKEGTQIAAIKAMVDRLITGA